MASPKSTLATSRAIGARVPLSRGGHGGAPSHGNACLSPTTVILLPDLIGD